MAQRKLEDVYPLSPLQEGILFHSLFSPESGVYVEQLSCALDGPLDAGAFLRAWERVVERHAVLRTAFVWKSQKRPLQAVEQQVELPLRREDWSGLPAAEGERRWEALLAADRRQEFELARAPLLRLALVRFGAASHRLVWTSHHLLLDGWSLPLVLSEVLRFYAAFAAGEELDLPSPPPYRNYIGWLAAQDLSAAEAFFRRELAGFSEPTEMGAARPVSSAPEGDPSGGGGEPGDSPAASDSRDDRELTLGPEAQVRLAAVARQRRLTLHTLVLGAWAILLGRHAGRGRDGRDGKTGEDVVCGETVSGRGIPLPGVESMVGLFINTLPVRVALPPRAEVGAWLAELQERQLALQSFEATPLASIQGWSAVPPGTPLLTSLFAFENYPKVPLVPHGGLVLGTVRFNERTNYPLTAVAAPEGDGLVLRLACDPARYDGATAARLLAHWANLLAALGEGLDAGSTELGDLAMLSPAERQQLLSEWNPPAPGLERFCLHERFSAQAARAPDAVALTLPEGFGEAGGELTYGELAARAGRLAAALRRRGVGPESLVAVCLERSPELVVALLAVLAAGGAYLPLDPAYPPERLGFMLADSGARVLVSRPELAARLPPNGAELVAPEAADAADAPPATGSPARLDDLAYVLYTSGSTGRPKGVAVTHANVSRLLTATAPVVGSSDSGDRGDPGGGDVWTLAHSFAFDFSVWEMWGALARGGRLVLVPVAATRSPADLLALLAAEGVTVLNQTPPAFGQLAPIMLAEGGDRGALPALRLILLGGEALDPALLAGWIERFGELHPRLVNLYGPTEGTVLITARVLGRADLGRPGSPLGRPLQDLRIHLLDAGERLAPPGVAAEIAVGGAGLARGYLGRPDLTAERFRPDPFGAEPGERLYHTGDLARRRPDGELEFLGRADRQVKVRGFRIELGEIEAALGAHPGVRAAAVEVRSREGGAQTQEQTREIVAYVAAGPELTAAELRAHLARTLPEPMLPAVFVRRPALPLLPSGKIDRRALAALTPGEGEERAGAAEAVAPRGPVEELLAGLWAEVLRVPRVGVHDNFFALGGDSILSLQVVARAGQAGCRITPRQLFEHPTVAGLAAVAEQADAAGPEKAASAPQEAVTGDVPLTPIQRWFFAQEPADPHHFNQALLLAVRRLGELAPGTVERAVAALVVHHDALRLRFRREEGSWRQWSAAPESAALPFAVIDLSALPAEPARTAVTSVGAVAAAAQGSLDLAAGPLLRALWIDLPAGEARLFLAVHHLAVDAVSWRVMLEDLATACRQLGAGEPVRLPPKTSSFGRWAERLAERAREMPSEPELAFWSAQRAPAGVLLPAFAGLAERDDRGDAEDTVGTAAAVVVELPAAETDDLLRALPAAYGAAIADGLLAALAAALAGPGGSVQIDLEGHGREELGGAPALDLSRTVGWFTSLFPLLLSPGEDPHPGAVLAAVLAQLAAVPSRGLGYGILRYLSDERGTAVVPLVPLRALRAQPASAVSFNYLGQLDATLGGGSPFAPAAEPVGPSQSPRARRSHALVVGAAVAGGQLQVSWGYGASRFDEAAVRRLAGRFLDSLRALAAHARGVVEGREPRVGADPLSAVPAASPAGSPAPFAGVDSAALAHLPAGLEDAYPLTPLQEGLVFHSLYAPGSGEYVEQLVATFVGELDLAAFREAWRRIVAATPVLRTSFHGDGLARPLQAVHRRIEVEVVEEDWRRLGSEPDREFRFAERVRADRARGFDLARPPLLRWTLVRTGEQEWRFLWSHHHALLDGWSYSALIGDFAACYEALAAGREPELRTRPPYRDFIAWLARRDPAADDEFFRAYLSGFGAGSPAPTPLVADRPPAAGPTATAGSLDVARAALHLPVAETAPLQAAARARGLTLNTVAQAAWALLLGLTAGVDDVVFGATVSGRPPELPGVEAMLGLFINTLPVRVRLDEEAPLATWLASLQAAQAELRQHEAAPLVRIQGVSPVPRGTPLFESLLVFENYPQEAAVRASALGRQITEIEAIEQPHYPLSLIVAPGAGGLLLALGYDRARFDTATAHRRLGHLRQLLAALGAALAAGGEERLTTVAASLLSFPERQQLVHEWNLAGVPPRGRSGLDLTVGTLWERQVARTPDAVALEAPESFFSYAELDRMARRLAGALRRAGAGPEVTVAVVADRSATLAWTFLAVQRVGAVYLPLDPAQPVTRLAYQMEDGRPALVVTAEPWAGLAGELTAGSPESLPILRADAAALAGLPPEDAQGALDACPADAANLSYVFYTSGSTGRPKGVATSNGAFVAHMVGLAERWAMRADDRLALFASSGFDVSIEELVAAWIAGGTVVVAGPGLRDPALLSDEVDRRQITVLSLPTGFWHAWMNEVAPGAPGPLRAAVVGGEAMSVEAARRFLGSSLGGGLLVNAYGPTEAAVFSTWRTVDRATVESGRATGIPLGRPSAGRAVHVLDRPGRPLRLLPVGATGELYLADPLLARAYFGQPDLTAGSFLPDPLAASPGGRLYRTGDLVRRAADGDLEFLGRADDQVKVHGVRIELAEVEAALGAEPEVGQAAVVAVPVPGGVAGERALVAFYTAAGSVSDAVLPPAVLRAALARRLPPAMIPSLIALPALPLTPNGKVDRRALAALAAESRSDGEGSADGYAAPRNPIEEVLAGIWEEVLQRPRVGVDDDFFALGGHSLLATQVTSRVRQTLGVDVPLRLLFERPNVASLAAEIECLRRAGDPDLGAGPPLRIGPRQVTPGEDPPMSFAQERMWLFDQLSPGNTVSNIRVALRLSGRLAVPVLAAALREVARRHETLRTRFTAVAGRPVQRIDPDWRPPLPLVDLSGVPAAARASELERQAAEQAGRPFDLAKGPLLRCTLVRMAEEEFVLSATLHHIISDGWSTGVLVRELTALYSAGLRGEPSPLPELPIQYADFAAWQRDRLRGELLERELRHVTGRLAGLPVLDLPTDRPPTAGRYFRSVLLPFALAEPLSASLQALARRQGVSLFMTLLAALHALLAHHTGQDDFALGASIASRNRAELEPLIGYFVNTLVLRTDGGGDPGFADLLARVRATTLDAYDHQDLPMSLVVEALRGERGTTPLLQVQLLWQNQPMPDLVIAGVTVEVVQRELTAANTNFAFTLELVEAGGRVSGFLAFNRSLFDAATAVRWRGHLETLLAAAAADPERRLAELPLLAEGERHQVLFEWSAGGEVVLARGGPAPIGIWGELSRATADGAREATGRRSRRRADGSLEFAAPVPASAALPAVGPTAGQRTGAAGTEAPAAKRLDDQVRRREQLSPAKQKLLEMRLRGGAAPGVAGARTGARPTSSLLVDLQPGLRATAGRPPFFCVHPIGGSVLAYRELARHLGPEQPFYGIQAAGLTGSGEVVDDLPAMAAAYVAAVLAAAPGEPYLLGGWSFGGVVAFEMARHLRKGGREVALVALLDSWAPTLAPPQVDLGEAVVVRNFLRDQAGLQGRDASWLDEEQYGLDEEPWGLDEEPRALDEADEIETVERLLARARVTGLLKANLRSAQVRPLLDVYRANVRAGAAYRPGVYAGRLTLFRPLTSPHPDNGWQAHAGEPVEVHELAADHYSLLAPPAVAELAERLGFTIARELDPARRNESAQAQLAFSSPVPEGEW